MDNQLVDLRGVWGPGAVVVYDEAQLIALADLNDAVAEAITVQEDHPQSGHAAYTISPAIRPATAIAHRLAVVSTRSTAIPRRTGACPTANSTVSSDSVAARG